MQLDMHFHGTYCLARAAGIKDSAAQIIATAAQFVDDCTFKEQIDFRDAGSISGQPTAHHFYHIANLRAKDQRLVWIPFHFLPGNQGDSFTERLICRMESEIVRQMVARATEERTLQQPQRLYRLGITAHVLADTYAHFGFSGVASRFNDIDNTSIKLHNLKPAFEKIILAHAVEFHKKYVGTGLWTNIKSWIFEKGSGMLGHAAVATYPDRPYLEWELSFERQRPGKSLRKNWETYLSACKALHQMFRAAADRAPAIADGNRMEFSEIEATVVNILKAQERKAGRIALWQKAALAGNLLNGPFTIPEYDGENWYEDLRRLHFKSDSSRALEDNCYLYLRAASDHRHFVLRELLPEHGLVVQ